MKMETEIGDRMSQTKEAEGLPGVRSGIEGSSPRGLALSTF